MSSTIRPDTRQVLVNDRAGHVEIQATSLMRLNYHDGMLLRAASLQQEQQYVQHLSRLSNQAGGAGIVHGFDCSIAGGNLTVGPGLAIDSAGRVLRLIQPVTVGIDELIARSRPSQPSSTASRPASTASQPAGGTSAGFVRCQLGPENDQPPTPRQGHQFLITIGHAEAACGQSEVYADPCRPACGSSSAHAYLLEGVIVRAVPLDIPLSWPQYPQLTARHLRSLIASAYFEWERQQAGQLISRAGLESDTWCQGAAEMATGDLAIGLLATGSAPFLDLWAVRRERMESPPQRNWAGRLAMRPWNTFLAQILQFQCQLRHCFQEPPADAGEDPCRQIVDEAARLMAELLPQYAAVSERLAGAAAGSSGGAAREGIAEGLRRMQAVQKKLQSLPKMSAASRWLIQCGIAELPSAGYLPVVPGGLLSVNQQVRAMFGEGVDLRFCAVRADYVPHALEEAQHMQRISLLEGLQHPDRRPRVDVLVPDGQAQPAVQTPPGEATELTLDILSPAWRLLELISNGQIGRNGDSGSGIELLRALLREGPRFKSRGAARGERTATNGLAWCGAGVFELPRTETSAFTLMDLPRNAAIWLTMESDRDPFAMQRLERTRVQGEVALLFSRTVVRLRLFGELQVVETPSQGAEPRIAARLSGALVITATGQTAPADMPDPIPINESVVVTRKADAGTGPAVEITLPSPGLLGPARKLAAFRSVHATPSAGETLDEGSLHTIGQTIPAASSFTIVPEIPLYKAAQHRNPEVASPNHPLHAASLTAIRAIATVLADPLFEEQAARRLFPPAVPSTGSLVIHATTDWVLFHRRREKVCAPPAEVPSKLTARRFRVYAVKLEDAAEVKQLAEALRTNQPGAIDPERMRIVSVVDFAAGMHTLQSDADVVRAQWRAGFVEPARIALGVVAVVGAARDEGEPMARARLGHLAGLLSTDTPLAADAPLEFLATVPNADGVSAVPYDGVMLFATTPTGTECHEVYRIDRTLRIPKELREAIGNSVAPEEIAKFLLESGATRLGRAVFGQGSTQLLPGSDDLRQAWVDQAGGNVVHAIVVSRRAADPAQPTAEEMRRGEQYLAQAARISQLVGGSSNVPIDPAQPEDAGPLKPCPAITVLFASPAETPPQRTVCNEVFVHRQTVGSVSRFMKQIESEGLLRALGDPDSFGTVLFDEASNEPLAESLEEFVLRWQREFSGIGSSVVSVLAVSSGEAGGEFHGAHRKQTDAIQRGIGRTASNEHVVSSIGARFPSNCPAATVILVSFQ